MSMGKQVSQQKTNNISLTGYKILHILGLLTKSPQSEADLNEYFANNKLIGKKVSDDSISLYINTLRKIGCKISRPSKSNNYKYELTYNPFILTLDEKEKQTLSTAIKHLAKINNWEFIFDVDNVFLELQNLININKDEILSSISNITNIDRQIILKLNLHCKNKNVITILHRTLSSDEIKKITILADEMFLESGKLYVWGYNFKQQEMQYFRVDKISDIKKVGISNNEPIIKKPIAVYKLKDELAKTFKIDENQTIISKKSNELIIEEQIINRFKFVQKILSYGTNCTLLSPQNIVDEIKLTLETLEQIYEE